MFVSFQENRVGRGESVTDLRLELLSQIFSIEICNLCGFHHSFIGRLRMVDAAEVTSSQQALSDEEVVTRVLAGETGMFEIIMRRHNQRLYRVARSILSNDAEAEDVMQDAYVRAYEHLDQFAGKAKFSTWLTRIAVHEALARQRRGNRYQELEATSEREGDPMDRFASLEPDPEQQASNREIRKLLEEAVEKLPDVYRTVFILRDVEDVSTTDAADILEISEDNVKVRLHRARALLRKSLYSRAGMERKEVFTFHAVRCDRIVKNVFERIQKQATKTRNSALSTP
jgi:RNA polymerase sigma-70 factor (ECF subfamily)